MGFMYSFNLIAPDKIYDIIPLLQLLNNKIDGETMKSRLSEMITQGYECVGVYDADRLIGISGLWILTKYYIGRHIEPDNVIIHPEYRGKGIGEKLMEWIYAYAKSRGCVASELNCYVTNNSGQKFWINEGYKILAFHFQKEL
jgi:GNAT superfamily N-acetyltransferase